MLDHIESGSQLFSDLLEQQTTCSRGHYDSVDRPELSD